MFESNVYAGRRSGLIRRMKEKGAEGIAIFIGNAETAAQYRDNCYKFRQESNWLYYFGIDAPMYAASLDLDSGEECIYADDVEIDDIIWNGPSPSVREVAESVGVKCSKEYAALDETVRTALAAGRRVHWLPVSRWFNASRLASLLGGSPEQFFSEGKRGCPGASREMVESVVSMRLVKEEREIAEIEKACELGYEMHTTARKGVKIGKIEQEIVGAMEACTLAKGWGISFATILTQHGEVFHCHSHENPIVPGKLLVVDAGAEANSHYASDFTRTYPTGGRYTQKQREIYSIVHEGNDYAFSITRPGITYREVHLATVARMLEGLKALGLVRGDVQEMVAAGVPGLFMPHGLGHNMGLDVHDMEDLGEDIVGYDADQKRSGQLGLGSLRMARRLVPGNVITDEPGIYFIPALIELWRKEGICKEFINFELLKKEYFDFGGIRLEDDVLVTEDGARRLCPERLPISPDEVEAAMAAE